MASDITLAVGDGSRRMTYAELAQARGISLASARRLARRHRWPRQVGNDGVVRILVPLGQLRVGLGTGPRPVPENPEETSDFRDPGPAQATPPGTRPGPAYAMSDGTEAHAGLGQAIAALTEQLVIANRRADEDRAEIGDLRRQLGDALSAERIARDEAAGLRTELDARRQWGLWRRVRGR